MSTQSVVAGAISSGFDRVEVDEEEFLSHDVVAQREGVYYYPDPEGGIQREFVPAEELHEAIGDVDETPVLVKHPDAPDGTPKLTSNPRANYKEVGTWQDLRKTDDEKGIAGRVLIRINEIGEHDGLLRRYINKVKNLGIGEVSTGYDIKMAESDTGRHNGAAYDAIQRGLGLDHLALLPEEQGDCSVEDGCGLGRANHHEDTFVRTNNHFPTDDTDRQTPSFGGEVEVPEGSDPIRSLGRQVAETLGLDQILGGETMSADSDTPEDLNGMDDEERVNQLVEEYGFTRDNLSPLTGTTCLTRIHEAVVEQDSDNSNMGDNPEDDPDDPGSNENEGGDPVFTEEQSDEIETLVEENTPDVEELADQLADEIDVQTVEVEDIDEDEIVEQTAEQAAEQVEQARAHEKNVDLVAESDELPHIDRERAQRMNEEVVAEIAEDLGSDEGNEESRANQTGRPTGGSFNASEYETSDGGEYDDIPSGAPALGEGGDD